MNLSTQTIKNATNKKYTDFSNEIREVLRSKMREHSISKKYANEYDEIARMKSVFSEINTKTRG
jgi:hypothetical protein